jgi:WD40 repeat protein
MLTSSRSFTKHKAVSHRTVERRSREVAHWLDRAPDRRLLIGLTEGEIVWDELAGDFDWKRTDALPAELQGVFPEEPLWLDLRWIRSEQHLSERHPRFLDNLADLSAALRGVPKDQIAGQDIREHRRTLVASWSAVTALVVLTAAALGAAYLAYRNEQQALSRQLAAQSTNVLEERSFDLALLLAAEALGRAETHEARDALYRAVQRQSHLVGLLHEAGKVRSLAFSPDGDTLASVSSEGTIRYWDVETRSPRAAPLPTDDGVGFRSDPTPELDPPVQAFLAEEGVSPQAVVALGSDGRILAVSDRQIVRLWSLVTGNTWRPGPILDAQSPYVRALAFSPREPLLASGSSDGTIALWDVSDLPLGTLLEGHHTSANALAFGPDGRLLASGGYSGEVILWEVPSGRRLAGPSSGSGSGAQALGFSDDGHTLILSGGGVRRWSVPGLREEATLSQVVDKGFASAIAPDLAGLALGGNSGEVALWNLETGERRPTKGHGDRILALAFSPDGRLLASAGNDRHVTLWDTATGERVGTPLEGHTRAVAGLEFSGDGTTLASYDSEGTLIIWDIRERRMAGKPLQREEAYAGTSAMALSPDGLRVAASGDGGAIRLWDVATWRPLGAPLVGHAGDVVDMVFSPNGDYLASAGLGGAVMLWDLRLETWVKRACQMANRWLAAREKVIYLGLEADDPYRGACYESRWGWSGVFF